MARASATRIKTRTYSGLPMVSQSKLFDTRVRRTIEISDDHPNAKNVIPLSPFSTRRICSREHKIQLRDWLAKTFAFSSTNHVAEFCVRANKFA